MNPRRLAVTRLGSAFATSPSAQARLFPEGDDLLHLWIAEPYVPLAPTIVDAVRSRADEGWFGYEERPHAVTAAFAGGAR